MKRRDAEPGLGKDDADKRAFAREFISRILIAQHPEYGVAEVQALLPLTYDLRKMEFWQEARQEGLKEGLKKGIETRRNAELVQRFLAKGLPQKEIAELLGIPLKEVRRLAKDASA